MREMRLNKITNEVSFGSGIIMQRSHPLSRFLMCGVRSKGAVRLLASASPCVVLYDKVIDKEEEFPAKVLQVMNLDNDVLLIEYVLDCNTDSSKAGVLKFGDEFRGTLPVED